jgi:hypothetical protein
MTEETTSKPPLAHPQPRGAEARAGSVEARKASPAMSSKQAIAAQRAAERVARAQAAADKRAAQSRASPSKDVRETRETREARETKEAKEPKEQKERAYAPWASLEPPAWALSTYRGKGPGVPPGTMPYETRTGAASATGSASAAATASAAAPTTAAPARAEAGNLNSPPAQPTFVNSNSQPAQAGVAESNSKPGQTALANSNSQATPTSPANSNLPAAPLAFAQSSQHAPVPAPVASSPAIQDDYGAVGRQTLQDAVPRIAVRAEAQVARVLGMAASAYTLLEERAVAEASRAARLADSEVQALQRPSSAAEARRYSDDARMALRAHRDVREAIELQLRAFGANPRDPETSGNLASLYLKTTPAQPEMARQLALVALTARAPQYHSARMEDWNTFAIASALSGREADARNALYVTLALTADVDARCVATLNAVSTYGERLRKPVEAMFYRLHSQGRAVGSQPCAWPPNASLMSRLQ